MTNINKFDSPTCKLLSQQIRASLEDWAKENGLVMSHAGGTYSDHEWTAKLKFNTVDASGEAQTNATEDWIRLAHLYGLEAAWLGVVLSAGHKIVGLNPNAPKNCVMLTKGGKGFKCSAKAVLRDRALLALDPEGVAKMAGKVGAGGF